MIRYPRHARSLSLVCAVGVALAATLIGAGEARAGLSPAAIALAAADSAVARLDAGTFPDAVQRNLHTAVPHFTEEKSYEPVDRGGPQILRAHAGQVSPRDGCHRDKRAGERHWHRSGHQRGGGCRSVGGQTVKFVEVPLLEFRGLRDGMDRCRKKVRAVLRDKWISGRDADGLSAACLE